MEEMKINNESSRAGLKAVRSTGFFFLVAAATAISAAGADLKSETVRQWENYVKAADSRHADRIARGLLHASEDPADVV